MMSPVEYFAPYQELAAKLLPATLSMSDGSHDLSHLLRVWKNVRGIQRIEGGNEEVLAAAVLLHDCVVVEKNSPLRSQASRMAAERAATLLTEMGWADELTSQVRHAIEAHSFSANIAPATFEARILQDADRLDAIGAVGIARCFYTAGRINSQLYNSADPQANERDLDDARYALDHFPAKLLRLSNSFQTLTGAAMARERHAKLSAYYQDMLAEIG